MDLIQVLDDVNGQITPGIVIADPPSAIGVRHQLFTRFLYRVDEVIVNAPGIDLNGVTEFFNGIDNLLGEVGIETVPVAEFTEGLFPRRGEILIEPGVYWCGVHSKWG